jgi:hypothetical protein
VGLLVTAGKNFFLNSGIVKKVYGDFEEGYRLLLITKNRKGEEGETGSGRSEAPQRKDFHHHYQLENIFRKL